LQGKGRNDERGEAAVSCHEVPEIYRNGGWKGAAVSCREVPEILKDGEKEGAAVSYHEMQYNGRIRWRGEAARS
jgi:hypothetical protein